MLGPVRPTASPSSPPRTSPCRTTGAGEDGRGTRPGRRVPVGVRRRGNRSATSRGNATTTRQQRFRPAGRAGNASDRADPRRPSLHRIVAYLRHLPASEPQIAAIVAQSCDLRTRQPMTLSGLAARGFDQPRRVVLCVFAVERRRRRPAENEGDNPLERRYGVGAKRLEANRPPGLAAAPAARKR